jgi:hypothetical protein
VPPRKITVLMLFREIADQFQVGTAGTLLPGVTLHRAEEGPPKGPPFDKIGKCMKGTRNLCEI